MYVLTHVKWKENFDRNTMEARLVFEHVEHFLVSFERVAEVPVRRLAQSMDRHLVLCDLLHDLIMDREELSSESVEELVMRIEGRDVPEDKE